MFGPVDEPNFLPSLRELTLGYPVESGSAGIAPVVRAMPTSVASLTWVIGSPLRFPSAEVVRARAAHVYSELAASLVGLGTDSSLHDLVIDASHVNARWLEPTSEAWRTVKSAASAAGITLAGFR